MKRIISLIILLSLSLTLVACDKGGEPQSPTREFTISALSLSGRPIEGVRISILEGTRLIATVKTGADGKARPVLYPGEYTLKLEDVPDEYEMNTESIKVSFTEKSPTFVFRLKLTQGDGSKQNPFTVKDVRGIDFGAGVSAYYRVEVGNRTTLCIRDADRLSAVYDGVTYNPNSSGMIVINDVKDGDIILVKNSGPERHTVVELVYPFGSDKNPHVLKLNTGYRASITGRTVHYTLTASEDMTLTLVGSEGGIFTAANLTADVTKRGEGACELTLTVKAGDKLLYTVSGEGEVTYRVNSEVAEN